jgi:iron-sulfur cluster insertion protein
MSTLTPITFGEQKPAEPVYNFDHGKPIDLTPSAVKRVKEFQKENADASGKHFRVYVEGGGCSGFQYGFTFDNKRDDDLVVKCEDIEVYLDPQSAGYINGAIVEYVSDFRGSGFSVKNPQAKGTCGCGTSFTV